MPLSKEQHLDPNTGPKRILALDGGGIRGVLTLEYLEVIEALLRQLRNDPNLLLSDYFDLIGGTSTGSIIAAGLACGMSVKDIKSALLRPWREGLRADGARPRRAEVPDAGAAEGARRRARGRHHARQRQDPDRSHDHDEASRHRQPLALEQWRARKIRGAGRRSPAHSDRPRQHGRADLFRSRAGPDFGARRLGGRWRIRRWRRQPVQRSGAAAPHAGGAGGPRLPMANGQGSAPAHLGGDRKPTGRGRRRRNSSTKSRRRKACGRCPR